MLNAGVLGGTRRVGRLSAELDVARAQANAAEGRADHRGGGGRVQQGAEHVLHDGGHVGLHQRARAVREALQKLDRLLLDAGVVAELEELHLLPDALADHGHDAQGGAVGQTSDDAHDRLPHRERLVVHGLVTKLLYNQQNKKMLKN